jgi:hypothetical protein
MASDRKHMSECIQVFQYNSNPAPSKLYGKVMNLLLKRGKFRLGSQVSFGKFFTFCTKQHTQSSKILVHFYDHLAALLRTAPSPAAVTPQDSLRLRSCVRAIHLAQHRDSTLRVGVFGCRV